MFRLTNESFLFLCTYILLLLHICLPKLATVDWCWFILLHPQSHFWLQMLVMLLPQCDYCNCVIPKESKKRVGSFWYSSNFSQWKHGSINTTVKFFKCWFYTAIGVWKTLQQFWPYLHDRATLRPAGWTSISFLWCSTSFALFVNAPYCLQFSLSLFMVYFTISRHFTKTQSDPQISSCGKNETSI